MDGANINMPSQNTFTLVWDLDLSVAVNPRMNTFPGGSGSPAVTYCVWNVDETRYNHSNQVTGTSRYTVEIGTAPCQPNGTTGTLTEQETFNQKLAGDYPQPWMYNITRAWSGTAVFGAGCSSPCVNARAYASNQGAGWTNYQRVYTYNGAYAAFEEDNRGSLEEGKLADLAVLSENILAVPLHRIRELKVDQTYVGGRLVYERHQPGREPIA